MLRNNTGSNNTATGIEALVYSNGSNNTATGAMALFGTIGNNCSNNTADGSYALQNISSGISNVAMGIDALYSLTSQSNVVAIGDSALYSVTGGTGQNVAVGSKTLWQTNTGQQNTVMGTQAGYNNTTGSQNAAFGLAALYSNSTGDYNTACGTGALQLTTTGYNTAVGYQALLGNTTGSENTALGCMATVGSNNLSNSTAIGYGATVNASNTIVLGNGSVTALRCNTQTIAALSDIRFKKNISPETHGLDFIMQLQPITYNIDVRKLNSFNCGSRADELFKGDFWDNTIAAKEHILYSGFSAQQVEEVAKSTGYDFCGLVKPANDHDTYGLSYSDFVVPLVKAVQEQQKMIAELKAEAENKEARLQSAEAKVADVNELKQEIATLKELMVKNGLRTEK